MASKQKAKRESRGEFRKGDSGFLSSWEVVQLACCLEHGSVVRVGVGEEVRGTVRARVGVCACAGGRFRRRGLGPPLVLRLRSGLQVMSQISTSMRPYQVCAVQGAHAIVCTGCGGVVVPARPHTLFPTPDTANTRRHPRVRTCGQGRAATGNGRVGGLRWRSNSGRMGWGEESRADGRGVGGTGRQAGGRAGRRGGREGEERGRQGPQGGRAAWRH